MDMDSSSSHPNWLAFSLSNHSLLFNSNNPSGGVVVVQENGSTDHQHQHLPVLSGGGPKLEDFLGGASASSGGPTAGFELYDSELKTIAASFLRGFSSHDQKDAEPQKQQLTVAPPPPEPPAKKAAETFGQRTSIFRGVTRHRWTGRYEAHLWDNSCRREGQSRKGRQVYLGGYDKEEKAARAYDLAAIKYWGSTTTTNFPVTDYEREMEEMKHMTRQEFVASLRRKSSGFSRGASIYRGVTRHHQHGRWQARIGRVAGNKDLYLGTFSTQEEAAEAYDIAAIKFRGLNAVTNFDMSRYDVRSIASSNLPVGGANNKSKSSSESVSDNKSIDGIPLDDNNNKDLSSATSVAFPSQNPSTTTINFALPMKQDQSSSLWAALGYNQTKNPNTTGALLFQESNTGGATLKCISTTPFSMEFPSGDTVNTNFSDEGFYNGSGYYQQQQQGNGTSTSSSACIVPNNGTSTSSSTCIVPNNGTTREAVVFGTGVSGGNWMPPAMHSFQPVKPNLSSFQTPIFGME